MHSNFSWIHRRSAQSMVLLGQTVPNTAVRRNRKKGTRSKQTKKSGQCDRWGPLSVVPCVDKGVYLYEYPYNLNVRRCMSQWCSPWMNHGMWICVCEEGGRGRSNFGPPGQPQQRCSSSHRPKQSIKQAMNYYYYYQAKSSQDGVVANKASLWSRLEIMAT